MKDVQLHARLVAKGFEVQSTGGGCEALVRFRTDDNRTDVITATDGASLPGFVDWTLCVYEGEWGGDEPVDQMESATSPLDLLVAVDHCAAKSRFPMLAAEFPDFDLPTLPAIPTDWAESSWHNDACPSFMAKGDALHIFVDYEDADFSENPDRAFRFGVYHLDADGDRHELLESNDWSAVLSTVAAWEPTK